MLKGEGEEFKEHIVKNIKTTNKKLFKYMNSRRPARKAAGSLNDMGIKRLLKDRRESSEKLNEFLCLPSQKMWDKSLCLNFLRHGV